MNKDNVDCIVARTPCCKRLVYVTVNEGRNIGLKEKREIADIVIEGYTIEHMTAVEVRKAKWGCKCKKEAAQRYINSFHVLGKLHIDNPSDAINRKTLP